MSHGSRTVLAPPQGELLPELRGGGAAEQDAVLPVRAPKRRASSTPVARPTGREDIEAAVARSGWALGERVSITGEITYLSADSSGRVWMRVELDGAWSGVDVWAGEHKRSDQGGQ